MGNESPQRERMTNVDEHLWRIVPAAWVAGGRVTNQAFKPIPNDEGYLSISREQAVTAESAYEERAEQIRKRCESAGKPNKPPVGVLALTVDEVEQTPMADGSTPLTAWDDSMTPEVPDHHGHIDFTPILEERDKMETARDILTAKARRRGWVYSTSDAPLTP